jgi:hypothetical protein
MNSIPADWDVRPWVFVPNAQTELVRQKVRQFLSPNGGREQMPEPRVTSLEDVTPWQYETPRRPPYQGDANA